MIAQLFGFTRDFVKERNNRAYFRLNKISCGFKEQARARQSGEKSGLAWVVGISILPLWQGGAIADDDHERVYELHQSGEILALENILQISRQRVRGKVIEVELEQEDNRLIYELEILDRNNRVWKVDVDAVSGSILQVEED